LDDPVEKYLPQFAPRIMTVVADGDHVQLRKTRRAITVRNLLTHTSGIPFRSSLETPTLDLFPLALRVESYALEPLDFEPGNGWSYSNAGINTAARIIEVVSGMRYEEFLQKRVFDPLGMKDTTFWPTESQLPRLAKSYMPDDSETDLQETSITQLHYPLTDHTHRYPMPAGGLFSTASDLGTFCQMFLNGGSLAGKRYLSESAIREMTRDQLSPAEKGITAPMWHGGYGLGWQTSPEGIFGHKGAYSTDMRIDPLHGLATVWLVQHAGFPGDGSKSYGAFEQTVSKRFIALGISH
jgi:CubicO group peptidase (beta-lactamase class C family)